MAVWQKITIVFDVLTVFANYIFHMILFRNFFLLSCIFLWLGCASEGQRRDIRNFYFPLRGLTQGEVYEYAAVNNDSLAPEYWYYHSLMPGDSVFLSATYYESDLLPRQQMTQKVTSNGIILKDMYLYEADSSREDVQLQIPVEIIADDVYPFYVRDSGGIFVYHVKWDPPQEEKATMRVIKNRQYAGDTLVRHKGLTYNAVKFKVRELFEYDKEGVLSQEYSGEEIYARGIGLIYYRKDISDEFQLEYRLVDRYPMEQLEAKFRALYGIQDGLAPDMPKSGN